MASIGAWPESIFVAQMLVIQSLTKRVPVRGTITGGGVENPWDEDGSDSLELDWNMTQKTYQKTLRISLSTRDNIHNEEDK